MSELRPPSEPTVGNILKTPAEKADMFGEAYRDMLLKEEALTEEQRANVLHYREFYATGIALILSEFITPYLVGHKDNRAELYFMFHDHVVGSATEFEFLLSLDESVQRKIEAAEHTMFGGEGACSPQETEPQNETVASKEVCVVCGQLISCNYFVKVHGVKKPCCYPCRKSIDKDKELTRRNLTQDIEEELHSLTVLTRAISFEMVKGESGIFYSLGDAGMKGMIRDSAKRITQLLSNSKEQ